MEYIHLFNTKSEHDAYYASNNYAEPWLAYIMDDEAATYNKPHDYSLDYLTTIALEDGTIAFNILSSIGTNYITSISFSTDNGQTWTSTANTNDRQQNLVITVNVEAGDMVLWKGIAEKTGFFKSGVGNSAGSFFSSSCEFEVEGNVMSLLYGDDFVGKKTLAQEGALGYLFSDHTGVEICSVVNAENMVLPATTLTNYCYQYMFKGCTSLEYAPKLPATTLKNYCYQYMFQGCTSLISAPELPATILGVQCYSFMFHGCTSLTTAPELPATALRSHCYYHMFEGCTSLATAPELPATKAISRCYVSMFQGCTSLTSAPALPATTVDDYCYSAMFQGCTSLTSAPALPATTLASACYQHMFRDCTLLTSAPKLPATTLANNCYYCMFYNCSSLTSAPELHNTTLAIGCYYYMFYGCASLTKAPELPATTLVDNCYRGMFQGCSKLNVITMLATNISASNCLTYFTKSVAPSGTFVKNSTATWNVTGNNGIPSGWAVQTASA